MMSYEIPNGLQVADMIEVRGRLHTDAHQLLVELATRDTIERGNSNAALVSDAEKAEIPLKLVVFTAPGLSSSEKAGDWVAIGKTSAGTFSRRNHNCAELNDVLYSGGEFTLRIIAFENYFEVYVENILVVPFEFLMPLDEVSHLMLSGDADFLALEFLDSREFLTAVANQTYSSIQSTALVEVEEPIAEEVEEPSAEVEASALPVAVSVPVDVNANVNMDIGDGIAGGVGEEQKKKKRRGSGHSSSSMDKSGGRVRVHNKADRAPGGADYLKGLFEKYEIDAGADADEEFDASTFGPDAADVDLTTPSPTSSAPVPKIADYAAPTAAVSGQYSVPSTQMMLSTGNTRGDGITSGITSQSSTGDFPLASPRTSSMQVNTFLPASKIPTAAANASLSVSKIPTATITGYSTKVDASLSVSKIPTAVATVSANGLQKAVTASVPIAGAQTASVSGPVAVSASGPRPAADGKLATGGGVKVPPGKPEEEVEEGVALKKAALGVRGAHTRENAPHATPEANFDTPDMSENGIVNFQNMGNVNSALIEGVCRAGRRLQAQGRFLGGTRIGAGAFVPDVERLYFALSSVGAKHFGDMPLGEVVLVVLVQAAPSPLLVAYVVRGERFNQVLRKPHVSPAVLAAFRPGGHFVVVALVKYRRLQLFVNDEHLLDVPLASRTSSSSRLGSKVQLQEKKGPAASTTAPAANGKGGQPETDAEADAQVAPSWFKYASVWGDVAAEPGPVYLLSNQLSLPYYDEIPTSVSQSDCPELMLELEFEPLWTKRVRVTLLSDDIENYDEEDEPTDIIKRKVSAQKMEFELAVGTLAGRLSFRHEKNGKEVDVQPATGLDDLIGLRGPVHLTFRFTEEEIIVVLNHLKRVATWKNVVTKRMNFILVEAGEPGRGLLETQEAAGVKLKSLEWTPKEGVPKGGLPCFPCCPIHCSVM